MSLKTFEYSDFNESGSITLDPKDILDISIVRNGGSFSYSILTIQYKGIPDQIKQIKFISKEKAEKLRNEILEAL